MSYVLDWFTRIGTSFKFWIVVPPWDVAIRVRLGKKAKSLNPGIHFIIPLIDELLLVNTRLRIATAPPTSISNGFKMKLVRATVGFRITDPLKAINKFAQPDTAVMAHVQALSQHSEGECMDRLCDIFKDTGICIDFVKYVEDVEMIAFRIFQNQWEQVVDRQQPHCDTTVRY